MITSKTRLGNTGFKLSPSISYNPSSPQLSSSPARISRIRKPVPPIKQSFVLPNRRKLTRNVNPEDVVKKL